MLYNAKEAGTMSKRNAFNQLKEEHKDALELIKSQIDAAISQGMLKVTTIVDAAEKDNIKRILRKYNYLVSTVVIDECRHKLKIYWG